MRRNLPRAAQKSGFKNTRSKFVFTILNYLPQMGTSVEDQKIVWHATSSEIWVTITVIFSGFCPTEPYDFLASTQKRGATRYQRKSGYDIAAACQRQRNFNYQISLPHFTSPKFLAEAVNRYHRFIFLKQVYHNEFLVPCYDFDIVWHTHIAHPSIYMSDCTRLLNQLLKHDDSLGDRSMGSKLLKGEAVTKKLWAYHFPSDGFWRRGSMYRTHDAPGFLGFENQDLSNITYGNIHIPSITLKDIPVQREQLRLKLAYGSKKVRVEFLAE